MRQVREVLRLKFVGGVPTQEIARPIGVAASTVRATLRRLRTAGLSWPLPEEMTDAALEAGASGRLAAPAVRYKNRRRGSVIAHSNLTMRRRQTEILRCPPMTPSCKTHVIRFVAPAHSDISRRSRRIVLPSAPRRMRAWQTRRPSPPRQSAP
jgi:hypothetical protein